LIAKHTFNTRDIPIKLQDGNSL